MNILFTVCGRAGSKGLKNKNLKNMLGKPLVYYTLSAIDLFIKETNGTDTIHVCASSDSSDLLDLIAAQKTITVFTIDRSAELSGDKVGKIAVIRDCLKKSNEYFNVKHDIVIDLDITSPIRGAQDIINAVEKKRQSPDFDIVFSVANARRNPYFNQVQVTDNDEYKLVISKNLVARQQAPVVYDMNASIYAYSGNYLLESSSDKLFDGRCTVIHMKDSAVLDIDCEEDFDIMEYLCKYFIDKCDDFASVYQNILKLYD